MRDEWSDPTEVKNKRRGVLPQRVQPAKRREGKNEWGIRFMGLHGSDKIARKYRTEVAARNALKALEASWWNRYYTFELVRL